MLGHHSCIMQLHWLAGCMLRPYRQQWWPQQHAPVPTARAASLLMLMLLACGAQQLPSLNLGPAAAAAAPTQDLALWNQAYQLIVENIPVRPESSQAHDALQSMAASGATADPSNWDTALSIPSSCSSSGYGTIDPATVPLNACFYKVLIKGSSNGGGNGMPEAAGAAAAAAGAVAPAATALPSSQSGVNGVSNSSSTAWQQGSDLKRASSSDAGGSGSSSSGRRLLASSDSNKTVSYWQKLAGDLRRNTNCYCYALDLQKNGFCTPGASAGLDKQWQNGSPITCDSVKAGLTVDGAVPANRSAVFAAARPGAGHFIAVFTRASGCAVACWESDYHMLRQDSNGQWSYKEPGGPAKNVDLFNSVITDPETAVVPGRYSFCAYFLVDLSKMKVGGTFGDTTLKEKVENMDRQRVPGVMVALKPLPYNADTDGAYNSRQQQTYTQDATLLQLPVEQQQAAALKLHHQQVQKQMQQQGAQQQQRQGAQQQQQRGPQQQQQGAQQQQQQQWPSGANNNGGNNLAQTPSVGRKLLAQAYEPALTAGML